MIMARGRKWVIAGLLVFCGLMGLALLTLSMLSERRFQQMMAGENGRWPIWGATLVMIGDHPLLGVGGRKAWTAAYPEAYQRSGTTVPNEFAKSDGRAAHAHNTVLAIAAEYGTPAAVLHIALIVCVLVVVWRRRQESPGGWQLACGIASLGFVAGSFEPYPVQSVGGLAFHAWLGLALGVALAASEERKSQDALPSA
jgi:O-antigen ligase